MKHLEFRSDVTQESLNITICSHPNPDEVTSVHVVWRSITRSKIRDLTSFITLVNLRELVLYDILVSDLQPLSNLVHLRDLDLTWNRISDLRPLSSLVNLVSLNVWGNHISNLGPIRKLVNLQRLNIGFNQISDLQPLSNLVNLEILELTTHQVSDLEPLSYLVNLVELYIFETKFPAPRHLKHLYKLTCLKANGVSQDTILHTIRGNKCQSILLESTLPRNYKCPLSNLREFGILGL